jgi:hypothetical protein
MKRKLSAPGGGQLPDCRTIAWDGRTCQVTGFEPATNGLWHLIDADIVPAGRIMARPLPPSLRTVAQRAEQAFSHHSGAIVDAKARSGFGLRLNGESRNKRKPM